jgi:hypothetical protein
MKKKDEKKNSRLGGGKTYVTLETACKNRLFSRSKVTFFILKPEELGLRIKFEDPYSRDNK